MEKIVNNCLRLTKWIPVIFIIALIGWSYYAYVVQLCLYHVEEVSKTIIYIFLYHLFLIMLGWSYYQTIFTPMKKPTSEFYLKETDIYQMQVSESEMTTKALIDKKARDLPILTRTGGGNARYCDRCKCIKPDRTHHCSICQECVLKMDHHCPWVNNCVGYSNYKFFILFLFYAVLYNTYICATSLEYFIKFWDEMQSFQTGKFHLLLLFFVAIMFGISVSTLLAYHIYLSSKNCTTLESFRAPIFISTGLADKDGFNLSPTENLKQIFGSTLWKAFVPIFTSTINGIDYSQMVRLNLRVMKYNDKLSNVKIMGNGLGYSSTIVSNFNSICSYIDLPTVVKSYRPQLARNPFFDDSFLVTSLDNAVNPQFNKINEPLNDDQDRKFTNVNTVNVIKSVNRHSSITFASVFNQNAPTNCEHETRQKEDHLVESSLTDGVKFPTSVKQSLAASNQNYNTTDTINLNERQALTPRNRSVEHIRITME